MAITKPEKSIRQQITDKTQERIAQLQADPQAASSVENVAENLAFVPLPDPANDAPSADSAPDVPEATASAAVEHEQEPIEPSAPETSAEGAEAAKASAPAIEENLPQEEWEDAAWEDPTTKYEYKIKARKEDVEHLKSGWERRADYDRKLGILGRTRDRLKPMVESGYIEQVLPFFEAIDRDQVLAQAVGQLYQQRQNNQPLNYVQPGFEQQPQIQAQATQNVGEASEEYADPYLQAAINPLMQEIHTLKQQLSSQQQTEIQQRELQQQTIQAQQQQNMRWSQVHQELARMYPGEFTGDPNNQQEIQRLAQLNNYASQSGYAEERFGYVGRIIEAKRQLDASTPRRVAPVSSAAASSIAAAQRQGQEQARIAAANVANGMVVGSQSAPSPSPQKLRSLKGPKGEALPISEQVRRSIENTKIKANNAR